MIEKRLGHAFASHNYVELKKRQFRFVYKVLTVYLFLVKKSKTVIISVYIFLETKASVKNTEGDCI